MTEYKKRILFIGIPDMAFECLEACCQTGINIVGVMGPKPSHHMFSAFKNFVLQKNLNFIYYEDLKSQDLINTIKKLNVDLAVVCSFNYKISATLLNIPKDGFINLHPSLLPLYRGPNPYSRVILNNETKTGVTLHHMSEEFDTGDIILQVPCDIDKDETMGTLFNKTNDICIQLLLSALTEYEVNPLPAIKQKDGKFPIAKSINDEDTFLNFNNSAEYIERQIRALNPFILASTYFRGNYIKVMKAEVINKDFSNDIENGTIVKIKDRKCWIKTFKGCLVITVMQYGSYFNGTYEDFYKWVKPQTGEKFY